MSKLTKEQIREKLLNRKKRMQKLEISLPDLEELDGHLAIQELTAKDLEDAQNLSKGPDGEQQDLLMTAVMITKALVTYDTKERIFSDKDAGSIVDTFGLLVLQPIGGKIQEVNGLSGDALEEAKKKLEDSPRLRASYFIRREIGWNGTREDMMEAMSNTEFTYWMAFFELESEDTEKAIEEAKQK